MVATLVCHLHTLRTRLRVQRAPGIPQALCFEEAFMHDSGAARRGNAESYLKLYWLFENWRWCVCEANLNLPRVRICYAET